MTATTPIEPVESGFSQPGPLFANRTRVYAKAVQGRIRQIKWAVLILCLAIYYILPWVRWNRGPDHASQAVLLDIWHERFYFFNLELWPQDIYYLTGLMIMGAVSLFLVTSLFGRVWCGFSCPQTVWTDLFMLLERHIEGDRAERMKRDAGPHDFAYTWRKIVKHAAWLGIAFWTGGAWIMYYVDAPTVVREFWTLQASAPVYFFTGLFTATTYLLAGWAREQVCTYMCPWPRFQAAMLDEQSVTVTYQAWRGEPRSRHIKRETLVQDDISRAGDCIDCSACVVVCPTGIDIRDGIQLECINCGLCTDVCNSVMKHIGRDEGLITWDTMASQVARAKGQQNRFRLLRPRTAIYVSALLIAASVMTFALATRSLIHVTVEHDRAPLFVRLPDGAIRNGYTIRVVNKSLSQSSFDLEATGLDDLRMKVVESHDAPSSRLSLRVPPDSVAIFRVLIAANLPADAAGRVPLVFKLSDPVGGETTRESSSFNGPAMTGTGAP